MQVCIKGSMQDCKYESTHICKYKVMQEWKYESMQEFKYLNIQVIFCDLCTSSNFFLMDCKEQTQLYRPVCGQLSVDFLERQGGLCFKEMFILFLFAYHFALFRGPHAGVYEREQSLCSKAAPISGFVCPKFV